MTRIWDTFVLNDELDILECRLRELGESPVWRHVLVEACVDLQGHRKPLYYADNQSRFAPWRDRIIHVVAGGMPEGEGTAQHWARLRCQRECAWHGMQDAEPGDIIMHSDADEIPAGISRLDGSPARFRQRHFVYAADWEVPEPWEWGTVAARRDAVTSLTDLRFDLGLPWLENGGWHLSHIGGRDVIEKMLQWHCHQEMDENIRRVIDSGGVERGIFWGFHGHDCQLTAVDVDETWPRWVREHGCPETWFRARTAEDARA